MKIKIKIKTIILIVIFILAVIPFANLTLAEIFNKSKPEVAEKFYDYYLNYPVSFQKDEVLYKSAETIMGGLNRYRIMMGMRMGEKRVDHDAISKAINSYKKIIKDYPKSKKYTSAYKAILDSYIYNGDANNLENWIEWGNSSENDEIIDISMLYEGYVHFANREYTRAENVLQSFLLGNEDMDYMYYFLKGHIEFARENFQKADEYYKKASENGWKFDTTLFGNVVPTYRKSWLEELDFKNGENKIKGRVTVDGLGIPFVEVYLQKANQGYSTRGIDFIAITDKDGYYETIGVKEGKYDVGIGIGTGILFEKAYLDKGVYNIEIPFYDDFDFKFNSPIKIISPKPNEIIKSNKFEIEWEEVEGADYYTVESVEIDGGAVMVVPISDENKEMKIRGNKGVFDIEKIKNSLTGYSMDDNEIVSPAAITGYLYEEKTTPIIVNAYDKNGKMVGSSVPMASYYDNVPSIRIEGELTKGEKLILNRQYEEAVNYYENLLSDDEDNIKALSYLAKLYIFGWGKGTKDVKKAINYGQRVYELTDNADVLIKVLGEITPSQYRKNIDLAESIFDRISNENRDKYYYWYRGNYHKSIGEFEKAREDLSLSDHVLDSDVLYIDLYYGEYERAIEFLKNKDTKFYYMSKKNLIEGIELLSKLDKDNEEYIKFKEYLSRLLKREGDYEERKEDFNRVYKDIKNPGIRIILNEIKEDNNW